jgi:hypothetical protein
VRVLEQGAIKSMHIKGVPILGLVKTGYECWNRGPSKVCTLGGSHPGFGQNRGRVLEQGAIKSVHIRAFPSWVWSKQGTSVGTGGHKKYAH